MWAAVATPASILSLLPAHFLLRPSFLTCPHLCYAMPSLLLSATTLILDAAFAWLPSLHPSPSQPHSISESLVYGSTQSNSSFIASNFMALIPIPFIFQLIIFTSFHEIQKKKNLTVEWKIIYFPIFISLSKIIFLCIDALYISGKISKILVTMITE